MSEAFPLEKQRKMAMAMFPEAWAKAERITHGDKRRRTFRALRDAAVYETQMAPLRAAGRSCATCRNYRPMPTDPRHYCDAESDFYGYSIAKADGLCPLWRPTPSTGSNPNE